MKEMTDMTTRTRILTAAALTGALALGLFGAPLFDRLPWAPPSPVVLEDDPNWDCRTQGNRVCGTTNEYGEPVIQFFGMNPNAPQHDLLDKVPDIAAIEGGIELPLDSWDRVDTELADALAEGPQDDATTRRWEDCYSQLGDTSWVICPDGTIEVS
jgi:hypothetical protein